MLPHGVMFHHFHGDRHIPSQGSIDAEQLADLLKWLQRNFRLMSARDWQDRLLSGRLQDRDVCLTFDDGLRCQYDVALPVLRQFDITAFWFIYSCVFYGDWSKLEIYRHFRHEKFDSIEAFYDAFDIGIARSRFAERVEKGLANFRPEAYLVHAVFYTDGDRKFRYIRDQILTPGEYNEVMDGMLETAGYDLAELGKLLWMDNDSIRDLGGSGHVVGLHSFTHPTRIEYLDRQGQKEEYERNAGHIAAVLGAPPAAMSHPCNSYNADTLSVLGEQGIRLGFRSNMMDARMAPLEMPREYHTNLMPLIYK